MSTGKDLYHRIKSFVTRTATSSHDEAIWTEMFSFGSKAKSGVTVNPKTALQVSAVFACIRVLSETIASLPLKIYKTIDAGKEAATDHYLYPILHDSPNSYQTSYEFRETMMAHLNMQGNFYAIKEMNGAGKVSNLLILDPSKMTPKLEKGIITYEYTWPDGKGQVFKQEQIWHVKGLSTDGLVGLSPITIARESIGLAISTEEYGARLFSNDARPGGVIEVPGTLKEDAVARLKKGWQDAHAGGANAHKVAIIDGGMQWKSIGFSNDDSQFLETRNFQVEDIARIFRVPSVLIGHPDKTATYASAEQFFLNYVVHTVRPWVAKIEQSANMHLLTEKDRKDHFVEFSLDGLLRGDAKSRYSFYASARQNKWMSANEVRAKENLNSLGEEGDIYENPNITIGQPGQTTEDTEEPSEEDDKD